MGRSRGIPGITVLVLLAATLPAAACAAPGPDSVAPAPAAARPVDGAPVAEPVPAPGPVEPLLPALEAGAAPAVDPTLLQSALAGPLADPALGPAPGAVVLDVATGAALAAVRPDALMTPASSLKVLTAVSALTALGPADRVQTQVVRGAGDAVVLVGGGDPTLATLPPAQQVHPAPATLDALARTTAAALLADGAGPVAVQYDASLFTGPALLPDWDPSFVRNDIVTPVSALTLDPASAGIDELALEADPAATTAGWFAARLAAYGVAVAGAPTAARAPASADVLAEVASPTVAGMVDRMLDLSDNDVAEALHRLAAVARGLPGTFDGGADAAAEALAELGVPAPGLVVRDGSGLSRSNLVAPATLARLLALAAADPPPQQDPRTAALQETTWAPGGLSVAGLTGSLAGRFRGPATAAGAGRVLGKTGTLTGVTSLTGAVATLQGRPVVFSVIGNGTTDTLRARAALDRVAATIAGCGCAASGPAPAPDPAP